MLVKNPSSDEHGTIHYHCVGEYLSQEEKLSAVASFRDRDPKWETLEQDRHGDWLDQRDESWYEFAPTGITKMRGPFGLFTIWSSGLKTQRDSWAWSFSKDGVQSQMRRLIEGMDAEISLAKTEGRKVVYDTKRFSWTRRMTEAFKKSERLVYEDCKAVLGMYRPFCRQWIYYDQTMNEMTYQIPRLFPLIRPNECAENVVIDTGERGTFISNLLPDLELNHHGQCFPLYWYEKDDGSTMRLVADEGEKIVRDAWGNRYVRHDAITDEALRVFREAYPMAFAARPKSRGGAGISKEDLFWYVYGILHSVEYRARFSANLQKELPRIPLAEDFETFCAAGRTLGELHLGYESVEPWADLEIDGVLPGGNPGPVQKLKWGKKRNPETGRSEKDYSTLVYNKLVTIRNIPEDAQNYVVNGRSPLDWMVDRYQVKTDKATGIVNDPNEYSDDPRYILDLICRLVTVSIKTNEIVGTLPPIKEIAKPASWPAAWRIS